MNIFTYTLFAYALTAIISIFVVAVIVLLNKILNKSEKEVEPDD